MTVFDGVKRPTPAKQKINDGVTEMISLLEGEGWTAGNTTMVKDLEFAIKVNSQLDVACHATIPYGNIQEMVRRMLVDGVKGAATAFKRLKAEVFFHVTLAEGDDLLDEANSRWYSRDNAWTPDDIDADGEDLAKTVLLGKAALGRK